MVVMKPGVDGEEWARCARCVLNGAPLGRRVDEPAESSPSSGKLRWTGGAHYVPDVVLD